MLEAILAGGRLPLKCDDYVLVEKLSGQDSVECSLSRRDPAAKVLRERIRVRETTTNQTFLVSGVDAGQSRISYVLKKDLGDWETVCYPGFTNGTAQATCAETLRKVLPEGWTLVEEDTDTLAAYVSMQGPTALGVTEHCMEVYGCSLRFDNRKKQLHLYFPGQRTLGRAFLSESANLHSAPEYKSAAGNMVTRLYARGASGVEVSEINGGKPYVECFDETDEIIAGFWQDERYTVPEHLLEAARQRVKALSRPERSWSLAVADLYAVDKKSWPDMELQLMDVIRLVDPTLGHSMDAQITELRRYPHHPARNEITISGPYGAMRKTWAAELAGRRLTGL